MRWLFAMTLLLMANRVWSVTNTAASTSLAAVQAAVDASSSGDVVAIPAGSSTWSGNLHVDNKALWIKGAGQGSTVITENGGFTVGGMDGLISCFLPTNTLTRISHMTIIAASGESMISLAMRDTTPAYIDGVGTPGYFRIDHITITNLSTRGIKFVNACYGVIDHCTMIAPGAATGISPDGTQNYSSNRWGMSWTWGTTNTIVVEDCVFDWKTTGANGTFDIYAGQSITFRNNIMTNGNAGGHGTDSGGLQRSPLAMEVYGNQMYYNVDWTTFQFRGGSVQIFSNNIVKLSGAGSSVGTLNLAQYRNVGTNVYGGTVPCCDPFGPVSGTNRWDGNTDAYGYPALDQIGRVGPTTYGASSTTQTQSPCYIWSNVVAGVLSNTGGVSPDDVNTGPYAYIPRPSLMIQQNRDYYLDVPKPGYTPLTYPHPLVTAQDGGGGGGSATYSTAASGKLTISGKATIQ